MAKRQILSLKNQQGYISHGAITDLEVMFSLTQWQEFLQETVPGSKSAEGIVQFPDLTTALYFFNLGEAFPLRGGGIQTNILMFSMSRFRVSGPIESLP